MTDQITADIREDRRHYELSEYTVLHYRGLYYAQLQLPVALDRCSMDQWGFPEPVSGVPERPMTHPALIQMIYDDDTPVLEYIGIIGCVVRPDP